MVTLLLVALPTMFVTRRIGVPYTLGLVIVGLFISGFNLLPGLRLTPSLVLDVFLPGLLFEGAWSLDLHQLRKVSVPVILLVGPGVLLTVLVCGAVLHFGAGLDWGLALLLSTIIAPTDPVAVLGLFRELGVGDRLGTTIEAESLFNDGVASVFYTVVLGLVGIAIAGHQITAGMVGSAIVVNLARLVIAGIVLGIVIGAVIGFGLRWVDEPLSETTATLVAAYGTYLLAEDFQVSGILAVIALGLTLSYFGRRAAMSQRTRDAVEVFWTQAAYIANALLFLLIGAEIDVRAFFFGPNHATILAAACWAIAAVLGGRALAVYAVNPVARALRLSGERISPPVLLWAGLRGALSLALVLALPTSMPNHQLLINATYGVVLFTLLVQGLTLRSVLKRLGFGHPPPASGQRLERS
jgi:CPA1 family monovalent cation:H+ antiporter